MSSNAHCFGCNVCGRDAPLGLDIEGQRCGAYVTSTSSCDGTFRYRPAAQRQAMADAKRAEERRAVFAEEHARIVAMLRTKSTWHHEQARKLRQVEHSAAALALEEMADRIERGEV